MIEPCSFIDDIDCPIPIIANVTVNGTPVVIGLSSPVPHPHDVESTFNVEEEDDLDSEQSAEVAANIDVVVEEEMTLRVFRGGGGGAMDIETIEEEEEPMDDGGGEEGGGQQKDEKEEEEVVEERRELLNLKVEKKEQPKEKEERNEEVQGNIQKEEVQGNIQKEEVQGNIRNDGTNEVAEERKEDDEEVQIGIELKKDDEEKGAEVAEEQKMQRREQIVITVDEVMTSDLPMPTEEESATKSVTIEANNEMVSRPSTSEGAETTVMERGVANERAEPVVGLKPTEARVGAVHVRQRTMEMDGAGFEEETPFVQVEMWGRREEDEGGRMEERRKLAEGEEMLRELLREGGAEMEQDEKKQRITTTMISNRSTTDQQMRRDVVIEQRDHHHHWGDGQMPNGIGIHRVDHHHHPPPSALRHQFVPLASSSPLSPSKNNEQPSPQQKQQKHSAVDASFTIPPGAHSPFGHLEAPAVDEEWRLSPKTLSRIKRLKVVMETNGKDGVEVIHHHPVFVKDTSRYWYKPTISREDAITMLKNRQPGTFIVRDSNSFPGAFGLALKVAQPPAGVPSSADGNELVRHFLIEPSSKGVRLKGCSNEPVFGTLSALVYQHSITPLALPCRLLLPEYDPATTPEHLNSNQALLERGAACNVTYLCSVDTESLTGPEALRRSTAHCFELLQRHQLRAVPVHFKVSAQGITLTDNTRSLFFRRHYSVNTVTFAGIDPESRLFDNNNVSQLPPTYVRQAPVFGFVARKGPTGDYNGSVENACHLFAELDPDQPASAVVRFITNVMMPVGRDHLHQIHQSVNVR